MRLPVTSRRCCLQDFLEHGDLYCVFQWLDLFAVVKTFLELQAFMVLFSEINYLMHLVIGKPYVSPCKQLSYIQMLYLTFSVHASNAISRLRK